MNKKKTTEELLAEFESLLDLRTPEELVEDWLEEVRDCDNKKMSLGLDSLDNITGGRLKGRLYAYIGYGGTRKSMFSLQGLLMNTNKLSGDRRGIYSTMEMSSVELFSRILDMSLSLDNKIQASKEYAGIKDKTIEESVKKLLKNTMRDLYGNNLLISQIGNMNADNYRKIVEKYNLENEEPLDTLVIDGLSMLRNYENETNSYSLHTKELKELAKEYNLYIPLICHCSKTSGGRAGNHFTVDNARFIRGSEKILDNSDGWLMFSLLESENEIEKPIENTGHIRFYDKRHSGKTIDLDYNFNPLTMEFTEADQVIENRLEKVEAKPWTPLKD